MAMYMKNMSRGNNQPRRRTEPTMTLAPVQIAYLTAETLRAEISAAVFARYPVPGNDATDDEVEAWLDRQAAMEAELGYHAADRLVQARGDELIEWMIAQVRPVAIKQGGEALSSFDFVIARSKTHASARRRVIELAMKYGQAA